MKIIDFIKKNKVPTIAASVVLVAAVAVGVIFGVMKHKDNVEVKPFGEESSSAGSSSTISVPPIEDNSSKESTSSEESTSSASETIETNSTPSKAESVSSKPTTTTTKPASSQQSNTTSSAPVTSTPSNSGGGNSGSSAPSNGGTTSTPANSGSKTTLACSSCRASFDASFGNICRLCGSKDVYVWTGCPDPSAHPQESVSDCIGPSDHYSFVAQYKEQEANKDKIPADPDKCWICGRPFGDGHNGTCYNYFENGSYTCHHYD